MKAQPQSPPREVTTTKIGNTLFVVSAHYSQNGPTISEKILVLLDREAKQEMA